MVGVESSSGKRDRPILIAVIAATAALLGAVLGGTFSFLAADRQVAGETNRSRAEFLRTQRQTAYSVLLADSADALAKFQAINFQSTGPGPRITAETDKQRGEYQQAKNKVEQSTTTVDIIGSDQATRVADDLLDAFDQAEKELLKPDLGLVLVDRSYVDGLISQSRRISAAIADFRKAARSDLVRG